MVVSVLAFYPKILYPDIQFHYLWSLLFCCISLFHHDKFSCSFSQRTSKPLPFFLTQNYKKRKKKILVLSLFVNKDPCSFKSYDIIRPFVNVSNPLSYNPLEFTYDSVLVPTPIFHSSSLMQRSRPQFLFSSNNLTGSYFYYKGNI